MKPGRKPTNRVGQTFNKWTVCKQEHQKVFCRCACGTTEWKWTSTVVSGGSRSCGCAPSRKPLTPEQWLARMLRWYDSTVSFGQL